MEVIEMVNKEKWYQSRRIWGACLTLAALIAMFFFPTQYDTIAMIGMGIASGLGITSWVAPKK